MVEGSSLSLGSSLGQDHIILWSWPRGLRVAGAAAGRIIESRDDYGREQAQLLAGWSVNSVRVLGLGAMGRATAGAPGQRAWNFSLFGIGKKETNSCQQCMVLLDKVFAAHPPTAGQKVERELEVHVRRCLLGAGACYLRSGSACSVQVLI